MYEAVLISHTSHSHARAAVLWNPTAVNIHTLAFTQMNVNVNALLLACSCTPKMERLSKSHRRTYNHEFFRSDPYRPIGPAAGRPRRGAPPALSTQLSPQLSPHHGQTHAPPQSPRLRDT